VLGGAFDLPHAAMHAIVLPHVLAFQVPGTARGRTSARCGRWATRPTRWARCPARRRIGIPAGLRDVGLAEADLDRAVDLVAETVADGAIPNPRPIARADVDALVRAAWAGRPHTRGAAG
jgi:maleylacetate reductase